MMFNQRIALQAFTSLVIASALFAVSCSKKPVAPGLAPQKNDQKSETGAPEGKKASDSETSVVLQKLERTEAPTTTAAQPQVSQGTTPSAPTAPKVEAAPCQLLSFEHKEGLKPKERALSTEKPNAFLIADKNLNTKTVCVRVNETPVRFKIAKDKKTKFNKILIGPVAKTDAKVTIRFCTGKASCKEDCSVPKDEFMEAIGGLSDELDEALADNQDTQWNKGQEDAKLQAELTSLKDTLQNGKPSLFEAWEKKLQAPACPAHAGDKTSKQTHLASGA